MLKAWDDLPDFMRNQEVKEYYDCLSRRKYSLLLKRIFDFAASAALMVLLSPVILVLSVVIAFDSPGGVFFRQERVTQYGRTFRIHKFRTMAADAQSTGPALTTKNDHRITRPGKFMRKFHLDEIPQLFDILEGSMSFVGTRPEVPRYVKCYTPEMTATLLLPAGVTSKASIIYQEREAEILSKVSPEDFDRVYIEEILPEKMKYNLVDIKNFSFTGELVLMLDTVASIFSRGE